MIDSLLRIHEQLVDLSARMDRRSRKERKGLLRQNRKLGRMTERAHALEERIRLSDARAVDDPSRVERMIDRIVENIRAILDEQRPQAAIAAAPQAPPGDSVGLRLRQIGVNIVSGLLLGLSTVLLDHALFPDGEKPLSPAALLLNAISLATLALAFSYYLTPRAGE